jgi:uncharacterized OB-fold protein
VSVTRFVSPVRLVYEVNAGKLQARFLDGLLEGRFLGHRCGLCKKVYVPPPGGCPTCAVPFAEEVELPPTGTVTTFCVVHIPHQGQQLELPYVAASVVLDGADVPLFHLIREIPAAEVRMGLRVRAVWSPPEERRPTMETVRHFRPTGEADASFESYRVHL